MMNTIVSLPQTVNGNDPSVVVLMISFALKQQEVTLPIEIPLDHSLAIKANLSISWNKHHTLRWQLTASCQNAAIVFSIVHL